MFQTASGLEGHKPQSRYAGLWLGRPSPFARSRSASAHVVRPLPAPAARPSLARLST